MSRFAHFRFMPVRFAPHRLAWLRFAWLRFAWLRFASFRFAWLRFAWLRFIPAHCVCGAMTQPFTVCTFACAEPAKSATARRDRQKTFTDNFIAATYLICSRVKVPRHPTRRGTLARAEQYARLERGEGGEDHIILDAHD